MKRIIIAGPEHCITEEIWKHRIDKMKEMLRDHFPNAEILSIFDLVENGTLSCLLDAIDYIERQSENPDSELHLLQEMMYGYQYSSSWMRGLFLAWTRDRIDIVHQDLKWWAPNYLDKFIQEVPK